MTGSETDVNHFTVERTVDGENFTFVGRDYSEHNSVVTKQYELFDEKPLRGLQYYRLKTEDLDGSIEYSDLVAVVHNSSAGIFEISSVYFSGEDRMEVVFEYDSEEDLQVLITDVSGKILYEKQGQTAIPGLNQIGIDQELSAGVYIVTLRNSEGMVTEKIVK